MLTATESLVSLYPQSPLFADLSTEARRRLLILSTPKHYEPGEILVREGIADPYMYVIKRGRVRMGKSTSDGADFPTIVELGAYRPPQELLSAFVIFGSAIPMGVLLRRGDFRPADYGLTLHGGRRVLGDAVLCTLPVLALLTLVKLGWKLISPAHKAVQLFHPAAIFDGEFHFFNRVLAHRRQRRALRSAMESP